MNIFRAIQQADPGFVPACIFDIGANVGQTHAQARFVYPKATIHSFEPVTATFEKLAEALAPYPHSFAHRLAFAARPGRALMQARPGGVMNRILDAPPANKAIPTEEVEVVTGETFCARHSIAEIGILKVDTEGHDLDVLVGFRDMLAARRIAYVEVECGISPRNLMHVPFARIADFMFAMGYGLFGLYPGGVHPQGYANLNTGKRERGIWYGNAVFVAEPWPEDAIPM
ncbi:FkbM family methyltransferase [Roseomonas alkaliterrae]|uniref:FkbM family methyltransferase n=1 Tax=Neoroseomonas alkaliterrae TaxID=1452450 RepID=A0A840Y4A7_9PROT|nr:FkbM family methyltransferase [Neoroseomonas alkaliterrae]MBB5690821.1 FkbM family methyltransferase [Neoroseomonas alkaliterrae]MBR0675793.1 FkbM family methyltransferase [Neoroseomonas alkaliterrae]